MSSIKKELPKEKFRLHPRNKNGERYDFEALIASCPELATFVVLNEYKDQSIDFFNPAAVKMLNKAILKHYYKIDYWDIPPSYLCPPIPGRADYIHHLADLLASCNEGKIPIGKKIKCLDVGVGANCIYPMIGVKEYQWSFVGSDIDEAALESASKIIEGNLELKDFVELDLQENSRDFFKGILRTDEKFDLTICNPPFHASLEEAQKGTLRKLSNLKGKKISTPTLNFGGQGAELWCEGGEERFVKDMIFQSRQCRNDIFWFSTLISKESSLKSVYQILKKVDAKEVKTIDLNLGNKKSRIVAWTFLSPVQQRNWMKEKW